MDVGQVTILLRTEQKIPHIYISYGEQKTLNEIKMRQTIEEFGKVKKSE